MILISIAAIGVFYITSLVENRFQNGQLATVVDSTIYPVYQIPYPAVTICNYNRIDWNRVANVTQK